MSRMLRRAGQCLVLLLLSAGIAAFALFGALPQLTSLETRTVSTGSMHPAIPAGALVLVDTSLSETPQVDDVVLFRSGEQGPDVVHRIVDVERIDGEPVFTTQGDANADPDRSPLVATDLLGEVTWSVPLLGRVMSTVQGNRAAALLLAVPAIAIILMELPIWYRFIRYGRAAFESDADDEPRGPTHEPGPWVGHRLTVTR